MFGGQFCCQLEINVDQIFTIVQSNIALGAAFLLFSPLLHPSNIPCLPTPLLISPNPPATPRHASADPTLLRIAGTQPPGPSGRLRRAPADQPAAGAPGSARRRRMGSLARLPAQLPAAGEGLRRCKHPRTASRAGAQPVPSMEQPLCGCPLHSRCPRISSCFWWCCRPG